MKLISTTIGSYPRPRWFRAYLRSLEGLQKSSMKDVGGVGYSKAVSEVLREQKTAGIDLCTDGQLLWHNMLCHLCTGIEGFELGGLIRYFDNNMYYQMPKATAKLRVNDAILLEEFRTAYGIEPEIKAVLSCFTITELSKNVFYKDKKEFVLGLAELMNQEAKSLADAGARYIQIDEPSLLYVGKEDLGMAKEALEVIRRGVEASFFLTTYFRDAGGIFPEVLDFPVEVLGLDFVEGCEQNLDLLREYGAGEMIIQAGVVDGRTTKMEESEDILEKITKVADILDPDTLYVSPNTGLEFLPYAKASEKLRVMCDSIKQDD